MEVLNLFWSETPFFETLSSWRAKRIKLNAIHYLSLESYIKKGYQIKLYTYNDISYHNDAVEVIDADLMYDAKKAYNNIKNGASIAHISDLVRIKSAINNNGIVLDMDAVIINDIGSHESFVSTMPTKMTGGLVIKWGKTRKPIKVWDESWDGKALLSFPIKIGKKSVKYMSSLCDTIEERLSDKDFKDWNFIMHSLNGMIESNKSCDTLKPIKCGPLPAWMPKGKCYSIESPPRLNGRTEVFGHLLPSINQIGKESYIVQHFYESAFQGAKMIKSSKFWELLPDDTLLAQEAKLIMGIDWRDKLKSIMDE